MTDFIIKKLPYDLTSNAGLALDGQYTKLLGINALVDRKFPVTVGGIPNSNILKSYLGLLVQGKNDFDAIEEFRGDELGVPCYANYTQFTIDTEDLSKLLSSI